MINVCTIVTKKTINEFKLLKFSLEQFHKCWWYVACDEATEKAFIDVNNVNCYVTIESDDCDHNIQDAGKQDRWMKVMMNKFSICDLALKDNSDAPWQHVLFLDCDMLFTGPIEEKVLNLMHWIDASEDIDAMLCQHMTNNWVNEAKHGHFNAGMFTTNSRQFLEEWRDLSARYKELNMYFEQGPLTYIQRNYMTVNLPINYDIGWWRFNEVLTRSRLKQLVLKQNKYGVDEIYFGRHRAVNFHVHMLRELETANFGQFLVDHIEGLMEKSNSPRLKELLEYYRSLNA